MRILSPVLFVLVVSLFASSCAVKSDDELELPSTEPIREKLALAREESVRVYLTEYVESWGSKDPSKVAKFLTSNLRRAWGDETLIRLANEQSGRGAEVQVLDMVVGDEGKVFVQWSLSGRSQENLAWTILVEDSDMDWLIADVTRDFDPRNPQR